jgi:hypothetical protein
VLFRGRVFRLDFLGVDVEGVKHVLLLLDVGLYDLELGVIRSIHHCALLLSTLRLSLNLTGAPLRLVLVRFFMETHNLT